MLSIQKQFRIILMCIIALVLALSISAYIALDRLVTKNTVSYAKNTTQKFEGEINYLFKRIDAIFNSLLFDRNIEKLLHSPYTEKTPQYISSLLASFSSYSTMSQDISDIALVSEQMSWSNSYSGNFLRKLAAKMENSHGTYSFGLRDFPDSNQMIFGCNVYGIQETEYYGKYQGSIILTVDLNKAPIILPEETNYNTYFILVDKSNNYYSFNANKEISEKIIEECSKFFGDSSSKEYSNSNYFYYISKVENFDYFLVSAIDKRILQEKVLFVTVIFTIIMVISMFILAFFMYVILHNMVTPLNKLSLYIEEIRKKPLDKKRPVLKLEGCSEIHNLNTSFHEMIDEQQKLTRQLYKTTVTLYETELKKKQAELEFLKSQINPHFLYNTLESIQDIALEQNIPEIAGMSGALGKLFRYNVKGENIVTFSRELEITMAYLDIQKARFPDKLEVICSVRNEALEVKVMKFLLQPLVENAVFHGIEPLLRKGTLFIGARVQDDKLLITIQDDGIGIQTEKLEEIRKCLKDINFISSYSKQHIGIVNVAHRLLLNYGNEFGLTIDSKENEGTRILLTMPCDKNI